ncbi:MAG: S8 family peptidase [Rhodothermales bacterium]
MAQKNPKIILVKEDIDTQAFAADCVKSAATIDALTVMQTDFQPEENTVQVNNEGSFFVANLSKQESKRVESASEVVAVVDDEEVFAFYEAPVAEQSTYARTGNGLAYDLYRQEEHSLPLDREEIEALDKEIYPTWNGDEEQVSLEQLNLLSTIEHKGDIDFDLELRLNEIVTGTGAQPFDGGPDALAATSTTEDIIQLTRQVLDRLRRQNGGLEVSDQDIETALRAIGIEDRMRARIFADVILPNLRMVYAPAAWRFTRGARARVAVLDTGIDPTHRDLRVVGGVSFVPGLSNWRDDHGHGTHCAGIIAALANGRGIVGVAPQADLFAVKVLNRRGSGRLSWILNGLMWCARFGMHVANLSLGSGASTHDPSVFNPAYEHIGRMLRRRGILCVAAAGNGGHRPVGNPARCPSFMAVSAIDFRRRLTTFTNVGPQVEICAPGYQVLSTIPGGYRRMSGTSMATPHVAGAAALVKSRHPALHGDSIRLRLMLTATDLGSPGRDWAFGHGLANCYQAIL